MNTKPWPILTATGLDTAAHEREVSVLYATVASVTAERDAARAEVERLRDIIRHNAPVAVGVCSPMVSAELDKRDAEIARLRGEVERLTALYRKADDGHDENMRETARLIGEVERLTAREREAAEWVRAAEFAAPLGPGAWGAWCPKCDRSKVQSHAEDCLIAAWLAGCKSDGVTHDGEVPTC